VTSVEIITFSVLYTAAPEPRL